MVGIFSKFSVNRIGHRRSQASLDERDGSGQNTNVTSSAAASGHGIEAAFEFKPIEHPIEPPDHDKPVKCPMPEPPILNDGRIWKERLAASVRRRAELPVMKEGGGQQHLQSESEHIRLHSPPSKHLILPSLSAPEQNIVKLLED
ncbi:uncharacterized protein LOC18443844 [Amborella trichopoda]|uniref:Uncharacterized protein n=1 Tax=Amborella trichopoda TaxID=13333 RepID=U5CZH4_AMBTC|nr:uncharacterized protein LOC18443844 [Amborella trichopoda]ERN15554.1 hypothetical protein AMTR_s00048p00129810 [Amborella trichopoda]|eukprot:XP_006854087.1 uncharacterized protein LOC18443844 [Amborella trichopoda]